MNMAASCARCTVSFSTVYQRLLPTSSAQLTALCFDKNERRLVTAGGDGTVFMWNFNNGSKLREYAHDDERMELVTVS